MSEPESYTHRLVLPGPLEAAFALLSDPKWLNTLTPRWFDLRPIGPVPTPLRAGSLIPYHLRWRRLPMRWTSRITEWEPPYRVTYEQARGPYRAFVHEHIFRAGPAGTEVTDRVAFRSAAPRWIDRTLVRRDLERIFRYRSNAAEALFEARPQRPTLNVRCTESRRRRNRLGSHDEERS